MKLEVLLLSLLALSLSACQAADNSDGQLASAEVQAGSYTFDLDKKYWTEASEPDSSFYSAESEKIDKVFGFSGQTVAVHMGQHGESLGVRFFWSGSPVPLNRERLAETMETISKRLASVYEVSYYTEVSNGIILFFIKYSNDTTVGIKGLYFEPLYSDALLIDLFGPPTAFSDGSKIFQASLFGSVGRGK